MVIILSVPILKILTVIFNYKSPTIEDAIGGVFMPSEVRQAFDSSGTTFAFISSVTVKLHSTTNI